MRVLLTNVAEAAFGDLVTDVDPGVELVVMDGSGHLSTGGKTVEWEAANVEVAWATADLFARRAPIRQFFAFTTRSTTLRWLQSPAAGIDEPVFARLLDQGVQVTTAHVNSIPIAEFVLRAALDHAQEADLWRREQEAKHWRRHDFTEIAGSTWLVFGFGSIGTEVAVRARAFGARVIGVRRHPTGAEPADKMTNPAGLLGSVPDADVVVLCAPATASTRHVVDGQFLSAMKPGSLLVNVGRGTLVDEDALLAALDRGVPDAAVLDVFDTEPLPADSVWWTHPRVTVTAHNAAGGTGRYARAAELFTGNLARYLAGEPLLNEATRD